MPGLSSGEVEARTLLHPTFDTKLKSTQREQGVTRESACVMFATDETIQQPGFHHALQVWLMPEKFGPKAIECS